MSQEPVYPAAVKQQSIALYSAGDKNANVSAGGSIHENLVLHGTSRVCEESRLPGPCVCACGAKLE